MNRVYYLTPYKNVPSILRKGLRAGGGRGLTELLYSNGDPEHMTSEKSSLYFTDNLESMSELIGIVGHLVRRSTNYAILEVKIANRNLAQPDERAFGGGSGALRGFLSSNIQFVSPSQITVLGTVHIRPQSEPTYNLGREATELLKLGRVSAWHASALYEPETPEEAREALDAIDRLPPHSKAHQVARSYRSKMKKLAQLGLLAGKTPPNEIAKFLHHK